MKRVLLSCGSVLFASGLFGIVKLATIDYNQHPYLGITTGLSMALGILAGTALLLAGFSYNNPPKE